MAALFAGENAVHSWLNLTRRSVFMHLFVAGFVFFWPVSAFATKSCQHLTSEAFQEVKNTSDLIAHVRIMDYSATKNDENNWTKAAVLQVFKGSVDKNEIHITGWLSYNPPLYGQDVGAEAVLLLKKTNKGFEMTDTTWAACVPSLIPLPDSKHVWWEGRELTRAEYIKERLGRISSQHRAD